MDPDKIYSSLESEHREDKISAAEDLSWQTEKNITSASS